MMKISVAAVPYFWSAETLTSFYRQLADTDVDIVYLGETVCSKRRSLKLQEWIDIGNELTEAGKEVVLSTLTLLEAESELALLSKISRQKQFLVEANDISAIQLASENKNKFVAGCAINIYNNRSLGLYHKSGMIRWCIPVELGKKDISSMIQEAKKLSVELEYQVFGRMPLAYSARCFTARHHRLAKDDCQFKCLEDEQGIEVKTQEDELFSQINGIQIQSAKVTNLFNQLDDIRALGIDILRIVPVNPEDSIEVANQLIRAIKDYKVKPFNSDLLKNEYEYCNGYWLQVEGMKNIY